MQRYISNNNKSVLFSALILAAVLASFSFAQNQPAPGSAATQTGQQFLISTVHVQLGAGREWEDLIRNEYVPALRKAGVTWLLVWRTASLGESGEYMVARPIKDISELDDPSPLTKALGQDGERALSAKLNRVTANMHTFVVTGRSDLGIAAASGYVTKLAGMTKTTVAPGRTAEYEKSQKELLTVLGKTNIKGILTAKVGGGGNPNQYISLNLFDSFADMNQLGAAFRKAATEANINSQQIAPPAGVVVHTERTVMRYLPELSIQAPAGKTAK
jgi:hypothetical protein